MVNDQENVIMNAIELCEGDFKLIACPTSNINWLECEVYNAGSVFKNIGGIARSDFIQGLNKIFMKGNGKSLGLMKNPPFIKTVGGSNTEYLGYTTLSGNNTFYFFRADSGSEHIVLANNEGVLITHRKLPQKTFEEWKKTISSLS